MATLTHKYKPAHVEAWSTAHIKVVKGAPESKATKGILQKYYRWPSALHKEIL